MSHDVRQVLIPAHRVIKVPDLPRPVVERVKDGKTTHIVLCYKQDPATFWRCTFKADHAGPHTWELHRPPE
jgi:hypothetical protein